LWLPPFYASPLRDGGYDISDYYAVLPEFGTMPQFRELVAAAHSRGIRVVTDLVMNHTSDAHPWFQASRSDPDGPYGDFYVWSDTDDRYADARIIFVDTETSNWTFDPVRRQFFWHRFFSHQPDLNFENPAVQEAIIDVVRFWMDVGIDGFRLDAVPYLFEEEGTNCENLPRTHEFLARSARWSTSSTRAGSCWPRPTSGRRRSCPTSATTPPPSATCASTSPSCRGCTTRCATRRPARCSTSSPTPRHPRDGQWGTFLRNHDELTLEMVTTSERAAMYGWYAPDPRMRANVGIRRRLATLLDNSRAEIELIHALLLSMPGSPCLYYGDEIGMGDNIWLDDRDGVRTPMQWNPDRNAGFSTVADPGKLYLPVVQSLTNHFGGVNVEAQLATSSSLLHWVRGMLALRKRHPVFGLGTFVALPLVERGTVVTDTPACDNDAVLSFLRVLDRTVPGGEHEEPETVLCVHNLGSTPQAVTLSVPGHAGAKVVDLFGGQGFPPVGADGRLTLTMGSRDFFWLRLVDPVPAA
jgi:maltose alpha-D-glucosyltransferase/alpha-amylase